MRLAKKYSKNPVSTLAWVDDGIIFEKRNGIYSGVNNEESEGRKEEAFRGMEEGISWDTELSRESRSKRLFTSGSWDPKADEEDKLRPKVFVVFKKYTN